MRRHPARFGAIFGLVFALAYPGRPPSLPLWGALVIAEVVAIPVFYFWFRLFDKGHLTPGPPR